jgi:hypothetical protein
MKFLHLAHGMMAFHSKKWIYFNQGSYSEKKLLTGRCFAKNKYHKNDILNMGFSLNNLLLKEKYLVI